MAVLYCFCNGEVRNSVRHHFERFRLRRTLRYGGEYPALQSTYYRTTASACCGAYHSNNNRSGGGAANNSNNFGKTDVNRHAQQQQQHRKTYALRMLRAPKTERTERGRCLHKKKDTRAGSGSGRYSDVSDSNVGLYRNTRRGERYRDSCVSFSTTNSYLGVGSSYTSGSPGAIARNTGNNGNNGTDYHSIPSSPEHETLKMATDNGYGIELQVL